MVLSLLLTLHFLLFSGELGQYGSLFKFSRLANHSWSLDTYFDASSSHKNAINQALKGFRKCLVPTMLNFPIGQPLVQILYLHLPLGLLLSKNWF